MLQHDHVHVCELVELLFQRLARVHDHDLIAGREMVAVDQHKVLRAEKLFYLVFIEMRLKVETRKADLVGVFHCSTPGQRRLGVFAGFCLRIRAFVFGIDIGDLETARQMLRQGKSQGFDLAAGRAEDGPLIARKVPQARAGQLGMFLMRGLSFLL